MSWAAGDEAALPLPPQALQKCIVGSRTLPLSKEIGLSQKSLTVEREEERWRLHVSLGWEPF